MNFRDIYRADMQQICPDAQLLADTASLLHSPVGRRPWRWAAAAAISAAALVCALSLPLMQADDLANQPALLCDQPDIAAYSGSAVGDFPTTESNSLGSRAMLPRENALPSDKDFAVGVYLDQIPNMYLTTLCLNCLLPNQGNGIGAAVACREIANFKIFN